MAADSVVDNPAAQRLELNVEGQVAFLTYERSADALVLNHTEVPEPLRGRGLGEQLVKAAIDSARGEGLPIVAVCPFARAYMRKHPL